MEAPDFKKIAAQLRNPDGADGLETAQRMAENNAGMIRACIDHLSLKTGNAILEIGFGGGGHIPYLLDKTTGIVYEGVDISPTMTAMALEANKEAVQKGALHLQTVTPQDGYVAFPFEAATFDHIFTVNTIYFWDNAPAQAGEIFRVLKPGGQAVICFATEEFMKELPFTQYDFHLYSVDKAKQLMEEAGFTIVDITEKKEVITSNAGPQLERTFILLGVTR